MPQSSCATAGTSWRPCGHRPAGTGREEQVLDEHQITEGLRTLTLREPALGFDPDDIAELGAKRRRNRRASLAAGAGTLAVAAVAAFVVVNTGGRDSLGTPITAATQVPASRHPQSPNKPTDPAHDLTKQVNRNRDHLLRVLPSIKPDAKEIEVIQAGQDYPDEAIGWDMTSATIQFRDGIGPASINVVVSGKGAGRIRSGPDECDSQPEVGGCERLPQPDGSVVVIKNVRVPGDNKIPRERGATHFRTDGTTVFIYNTTGFSVSTAARYGLPNNNPRSDYPLNDAALVTLVTDRQFNVD
ncbi:hypothetical protein [Actinocrispum sp. NPDC049592]|uniref:hypothetical protein n=1 Tax=Actinocrispum sp. NPDC049592 TaxID=3154835 RepID=UPI0034402C6D